MIGQVIREVLAIPGASAGEWPDFQIVTDRACWRYTGQTFVHDRRASAGGTCIPEAQGTVVSAVFVDGESAVVALADGAALVFDLAHDPEAGRSWPEARFVRAGDFLAWSAELAAMERIVPDPR